MAPWPNIQKHQIKSKVVVYVGLVISAIGAIYLLANNIYQSRESSALYSQNPGSVETSPITTTSQAVGAPSPKITLLSLTPTTTPIQEAKTLADISWFYPELTWKTTTITPDQLASYVRYDSKNVSLNWQAWTVVKKFTSGQENSDFDNNFEKYYATLFSTMDWIDWKAGMINGIQLQLKDTYGPGGQERSFVGVKDGKFRVFVFRIRYDDQLLTNSPDAVYPQNESYTIFLSDITSSAQLRSLLQ